MSEGNRFKDFDAFYAEQEREPVKFKLFGEEHILPPALPALVVVKLVRMEKKYGSASSIPHEDLVDMCIMFFGEEKFEALCGKGLDVDQMGDLIKWLMEEYLGVSNSEKNVEKVPVEISSNTGA